MIKKTVVMLFVFILAISFFVTTSHAQPLTFDPPVLIIEGKIGDLVLKQINITNNEIDPFLANIEYIGDTTPFIPNSAVELDPYETKSITVGFIIKEEEYGWLKYTNKTDETETISQLVVTVIEKSDTNLIIFPDNPKAGSSVAFMITEGDILDAHGFLFCSESGNIYKTG